MACKYVVTDVSKVCAVCHQIIYYFSPKKDKTCKNISVYALRPKGGGGGAGVEG